MRRTKQCSIKTIQRVLDKYYYGKKLPKRCWLNEYLGVWTAIDNSDGNCWTEDFKTEFAARLWLECERYDAEYIKGCDTSYIGC